MITYIEYPVRYITIDDNKAGQRIDNFLINALKTAPKSHIYNLIRRGEVRVNKKRIKAPYRLAFGDIVRLPPIKLNKWQNESIKPPHEILNYLSDKIVMENNNFMVINKPSGLAVHSGSGIEWGVIEILRHLRTDCKFLELAHRLDRETSGCLLIAKKASILKEVQDLFRQRKVIKKYWALFSGHWPSSKEEITINLPLQKIENENGDAKIITSIHGKPASTKFILKKQYLHPIPCYSAEIELYSGRMHQIRAHAKYGLACPIINDSKYGSILNHKIGLCQRLALHAYQLCLQLSNGEKLDIIIPLEKDLTTGLKDET